MRLLIRILGVIALILIIVSFFHHPAKPATKPQPKPNVTTGVCGSNAAPCIEMTTPDKSYKFNDFQSQPNGCIMYVALPDHIVSQYCGVYDLHWIGPDPQSEKGA